MYVLRTFWGIGLEWTGIKRESWICSDDGVVEHVQDTDRWSSDVKVTEFREAEIYTVTKWWSQAS